MAKFSFGSDPEMFISNSGDMKSAISLLPKKENAEEDENGNSFYYDNVLAEMAIKPADSLDEGLTNTRNALISLASLINPNKFIIKASENFPSRELNCPEARIAGCNPEWDVYSLQVNEPPKNLIASVDGYLQFKNSFRSAGGHIHLGSERLLNPIEMFHVIKMMDLFIAIPSIFLDKDPSSKDRRKVYGKAGSHRMPEYGLEYRVLGNFWLSSPELFSLIYNLTDFTLDFVEQEEVYRFWSVDESVLDSEDPSQAFNCFGYDVELLKKCINTCDKKQAEKFLLFIENYLPEELISEIHRLEKSQISDPYEAWNINAMIF